MDRFEEMYGDVMRGKKSGEDYEDVLVTPESFHGGRQDVVSLRDSRRRRSKKERDLERKNARREKRRREEEY